MDYGIIFVLILIISFVIICVLIARFISEARNYEKEREQALIDYLLSLSPEQREIELALMNLKEQQYIRRAIIFQTYHQDNNSRR